MPDHDHRHTPTPTPVLKVLIISREILNRCIKSERRIPITAEKLKEQRQLRMPFPQLAIIQNRRKTLQYNAFHSDVPFQAENGIEHYNIEKGFQVQYYLWRLEW